MSATNTPFATFAHEVRLRVDRRLERIFREQSRQLAALNETLPTLGGAVADLSLRGGKRLRAVLSAAGFVAAAPHADLEPAICAGAAFELLQTYFLIHDDWMDGDELRRGGPTAHVALARSLGGSKLGEWGAILAGDYAVALAQAELASAPCQTHAVIAALRQFADIQKDTVAGQFLDVTGAAAQSTEYLLEELKTCSYTVRGPLVIGATLGGATLELLRACHDYARPLGIAFQLRDDLLGLFGDMALTGKARGSDLRAGKMTFVIQEALRTAGASDREALRSVLGKKSASDAAIESALDVLRSSGAVACTEARIAALHAEANLHLTEGVGFSTRSIEHLSQLSACLTERVA